MATTTTTEIDETSTAAAQPEKPCTCQAKDRVAKFIGAVLVFLLLIFLLKQIFK